MKQVLKMGALGLSGYALMHFIGDALANPWAYNALGARSPAGEWVATFKNPAGEAMTFRVWLKRGNWSDKPEGLVETGSETHSEAGGYGRLCGANGASWKYFVTGQALGWLGREFRFALVTDPARSPRGTYRLGDEMSLVWASGHFTARIPWLYVDPAGIVRSAKAVLRLDDPRLVKTVERINNEPDPHPELRAPAVLALQPARDGSGCEPERAR
jgi:hypothetical protein